MSNSLKLVLLILFLITPIDGLAVSDEQYKEIYKQAQEVCKDAHGAISHENCVKTYVDSKINEHMMGSAAGGYVLMRLMGF